MSIQVSLVLLFFSVLIVSTAGRTLLEENDSVSTTDHHKQKGTKWALLIAGSSGYDNYRHQADVCHAYQILKKNGLKDENIIVFMYDDIANNTENPRKGVIINKPKGKDVYHGVPKDYTGDAVNSSNFYAAILGDKSAIKGGSGKVLETGPDDHIFIYYTDHGAAGLLGMPNMEDVVYAKDLMRVLKKKRASKGFKSMVFYLEACESGSMFDGLLPKNINIYATTAANGEESSYATYCDGDIPRKIGTCLGDLYSISWLEDCDVHDLRKVTFEVQYERVKNRTDESHVMQYGDMSYVKEFLDKYMGASSKSHHSHATHATHAAFTPSTSVSQRDASLVRFLHKVNNALPGSQEHLQAQKQLDDEVARRKRVDESITKIGKLLFGDESSSGNSMMKVRPSGQPLVDDWECFKAFIKTYENRCGKLSTYGMKYTRAFANMCNDGIGLEKLDAASDLACSN